MTLPDDRWGLFISVGLPSLAIIVASVVIGLLAYWSAPCF